VKISSFLFGLLLDKVSESPLLRAARRTPKQSRLKGICFFQPFSFMQRHNSIWLL